MTARVADWWPLLRGLDDPDHLEAPPGYSHREVRARFDQLVQRLDEQFACGCRADRDVQDASHHGDIVIPAEGTASAQQIWVRVSNFGDLAVYSPQNLGCYTEAEKLSVLPDEDRSRVEGTLTEQGYLIVPEDLLYQRYDGRSNLATHYSPQHPPTWFIRFFDYL